MLHALICDMPVSRRQRMHHIIDPAGDLRFSAGKVEPCLIWLFENGIGEFLIETEEHKFLLTIIRVPAEAENPAAGEGFSEITPHGS